MMWRILTGGLAALITLACSASDGTPRPIGLLGTGIDGCRVGDCGECATCFQGCVCAGTSEALCAQHCSTEPVGGSGGSSNGGGGGGESSSNCPYPTGQTGTMEGTILREGLQWQGYRENSSELTTIAVPDYLDCDGSRGINALLFTNGALWCPNCNQETSEFDDNMANKWDAMGIKILSLVIEDQSHAPATEAAAQAWRGRHGGKYFSVAIDPKFTFAKFGENGLPTQIVIDPRTMEIIYRQEGYSPNYPALENLAQRNAQ